MVSPLLAAKLLPCASFAVTSTVTSRSSSPTITPDIGSSARPVVGATLVMVNRALGFAAAGSPIWASAASTGSASVRSRIWWLVSALAPPSAA